MPTNFEGIHPTRITQIFLLSLILLIGWVLWREMYFMLGGFFGAVTLYVLLRRPMLYLVFKKKWKRAPAAILLMLLSIVVIIYPFAWVIQILVEKLAPVLKDATKLKESLTQIQLFLLTRYNFEILSQDNINKMTGLATGIGGKILSSTLNTLTNLVISYFLLWFMLMQVGSLQRWLRKVLPVRQENSEKLLSETREIIISNAIGIPILGLVQGVVAMIGYIIFGIKEYILWGIITGIASVIPLVGTMAAWVPLAILTFARGDTANGIGLTLWGLLAIGMSDNIFRFVLQKYLADIHPIITVFGVIVGLNLFGFLGLIFGPLIISLFLLLVRIYYDEYVKNINVADNSAEEG